MRYVFRPILILLLVLAVGACASGTVTTSTGAVRPATEVQAQDNVADVLKMLKDAHRQAVVQYEATKATMPADERAHQYRLLTDMANGLDASWGALLTTKQLGSGATPAAILKPIFQTVPAFLDLAVRTGLLTKSQADVVKGILATIPVARSGPILRWTPPLLLRGAA